MIEDIPALERYWDESAWHGIMNMRRQRNRAGLPPVLAMAAVMAATGTMFAATLVVDNQHPQAVDTNPGTRKAPLRTVSAAAARAVAGDEVIVRPGIYRESVTLTKSGAPGRPIVFRSEEPRQAVISGSDVVTNWQAEAPGVWAFVDPSLKKIPASTLFGNGEWVYVNGYPLEGAAVREQLLPGSFYQDFEAKRVCVSPEEGLRIEDLTVEYAHRIGLMTPRGLLDDIHIIGFTLIHNANARCCENALATKGQRWVVEGNHILWASYWGMGMNDSKQARVRQNLIEWCGDSGIGGGPNVNMLVESNVVRYCNWRRINPSFEGGGSKWVFTADSRVRGNEFAYCHGWAIWFDTANSGNVYEQNVTHDNTQAGLFPEISWDETIRDNVSFNNGRGIDVGESPGTVLQRNICFNNKVGINLRSDARRANVHQHDDTTNVLSQMCAIPGIDPMAADRWAAGYLKYWVAPPNFMLNNCVIWDNLLFDNTVNYYERRNYGKPAPTDPFLNAFSDYNVFFARSPASNVEHASGAYNDLAEWRRVSGRDERSVVADPRALGTNLPAWAEAKRALWDIKLRSMDEIRALRLGLVESPMACIAQGRIIRSPYVKPVTLGDASVKAFLFEVEGRRAMGFWTGQLADRRYLRLKLGQKHVTVENGYLGRTERPLKGGAIDLVATYVPTYLLGVGERIVEAPTGSLVAEPFNQPGAAVPVRAVFVNEGKAPLTVRAIFSVSRGFRPEPAEVTRKVPAGATIEMTVRMVSDGTLRKGFGQVRMEAQTGMEQLVRVAAFGVGESTGKLPSAPGPIVIDGKLDDWGALVTNAIPIGMIADISQFANGNKGQWMGPDDLSAKIYAVWTPQALCVAVAVTDDAVLPTPPGAKDPWSYDAVEVFLDGRSFEMQWQPQPTEGCYQIGVSPAKDGVPSNTRVFDKFLTGLRTATTLTDKGYIVELMIPLTGENFPACGWKEGRPIKLSMLVNDKDDPVAPGRKYVFGWAASPKGENYRDTSGWQTMTLGE